MRWILCYFITFVLSKLKTKLLAANHLLIRPKTTYEQNKFKHLYEPRMQFVFHYLHS